jgi:hypothetical protein
LRRQLLAQHIIRQAAYRDSLFPGLCAQHLAGIIFTLRTIPMRLEKFYTITSKRSI